MRRADRLFQILQFLRGGRLITAARLAEKLEVTPRTIYRDVAHLIGSGVPIEGEAGVGYIMREGYDLPPLMFTPEEITALVAGARLLQTWGGTRMAANAEEALVKIDTVLPDALKAQVGQVPIHTIDPLGGKGDWRDLLDQIESGAETRPRLEMTYRDETGAETSRVIRPLGVWFWGKVWTAVCWCELRDDFRMFRVDRIETLKPLDRFQIEKGQRLQDFYETGAYRRGEKYGPPPYSY